MNIRLGLDPVLTLLSQLNALPDRPYIDRKGNPCRHPLGIYLRSLSSVLCAMEDLSRTVPTWPLRERMPHDWRPTILALQMLFQAVDSHADNLKTILEAANPTLDERIARSTARRIDDSFEELVGRPFAHVRHHDAAIEMRYCQTPTFCVYGYFMAAADPAGVISPSKGAHGGHGVGWTFAVTVRRLLGQLLGAATLLGAYVGSAKPPGTTATLGRREFDALVNVANWLDLCPRFGFAHELRTTVPDVFVRDGQPHIRVNAIKRLKPVESLKPARWVVSFTGDGKSTTFSIL